MKNKELNEMIINNYKEYLDGELLTDAIERIGQYVATLYYDLLDDIELHKEMFGIYQNEDDYESAEMIENMIREILMNIYIVKIL